MSTMTQKTGLAAFAIAAMLAGPAAAQQPAPAAPAGQPAGQPQQAPNGPVKIQMQTFDKTNWVKVCPTVQQGGKEFCMTTRDFTTAQDQPPPIALAIYDV